MFTSMTSRFVTRLRNNVEAWRAGEIDFPTFNEWQRDTWAAIRVAGPAVEAEVVCALYSATSRAGGSQLAGDERRTVQARTARRATSRAEAGRYCGELERTASGSPVLRLSPANPGGRHAEHRQMTAFLYELAADMERRSQQLEAHWTISPDAENSRVVIELTGDHEAELAEEFVANVMFQHHLI
jgi:hypothetical protein